MANSAPGANASPNIFAVNPNGYITIVASGGLTAMWLPNFIPKDLLPCYDDIIIKQAKVKVGNTEGYECRDCKDFYPMAELNQPDNAKEYKTFSCYSCRKGLKTIFEEIGVSK